MAASAARCLLSSAKNWPLLCISLIWPWTRPEIISQKPKFINRISNLCLLFLTTAQASQMSQFQPWTTFFAFSKGKFSLMLRLKPQLTAKFIKDTMVKNSLKFSSKSWMSQWMLERLWKQLTSALFPLSIMTGSNLTRPTSQSKRPKISQTSYICIKENMKILFLNRKRLKIGQKVQMSNCQVHQIWISKHSTKTNKSWAFGLTKLWPRTRVLTSGTLLWTLA